MTPKAKEEAQKKIIDRQKKLREMQAKLENDLNTAQSDAMKEIVKKIEGVVNKIAANKKIDLVIAKAATAYNKPELDITDEVIKEMKK